MRLANLAIGFILALGLAACSQAPQDSTDPSSTGKADSMGTTVLADSVDLTWLYEQTKGSLQLPLVPLDPLEQSPAQAPSRYGEGEQITAAHAFIGYPISNAAAFSLVGVRVQMNYPDDTIPVICLIKDDDAHYGSCVEGTPDNDDGYAVAGVSVSDKSHPAWRKYTDLAVVTSMGNWKAQKSADSGTHGYSVAVTYIAPAPAQAN
jgi:hypothetical protein